MTHPSDIAGLSERLRADAKCWAYATNTVTGPCVAALEIEAATQLDSLLKERDALRNEINDWANEVARYKSYAEKFDQENAALQVRVKELEASQQRQFDKYQAALKSGATSPPTEEGIAAAIRQTEYKYFGDYEFSESQWDAVHCLVNAAHHYLTAEARVKELEAENTSLAIRVEKMICAKLGREWTPSGISVVSLIDELSDRATRAEQQRDEALTALKPFSDVTAIEVAFSTVANKLYRLDYRATFETQLTFKHFKDANEVVRRLASSPEGGNEGEK